MTPALVQLQIDQARLDRLANVDLFEWVKARLIELDLEVPRHFEMRHQTVALVLHVIAEFHAAFFELGDGFVNVITPE